MRIFQGYLQFFISLQFWPLLFAILNSLMTAYGAYQSSKHGAITLVNIDKIDELHTDLAGVAGYLMLMIPFIAKGLVSNFSDSFNKHVAVFVLKTDFDGALTGMTQHPGNSMEQGRAACDGFAMIFFVVKTRIQTPPIVN